MADEARLADNFDHEAAAALGRLVAEVIDQPSMRQRFRAEPVETAREAGVDINEKTERLILTLAALSPAELRLLSELNRTFINEGLYVETGNPPLFVH
jgi:hypothetical protein